MSSTIIACAVTKVELNSSNSDVNPVHSNKPTVNCACIMRYTIINPKTDNNCTNIDPSESLL